MANFKTRRLPQSPQQMSSLTDLNEHIQNTGNPHPQYLLVDVYAGGNGSVDLTGHLRTSVYNQYTAENEDWKTTHLAAGQDPHNQYVLKTTYTPKITSIENDISGLSGTVTIQGQTIDDHEARIVSLEGDVAQHTTDISGLADRMTIAEGDIGSLQSNKLDTTTFSTFFDDDYTPFKTSATNHIGDHETNCHPQYVLASAYTAKIAELEGLISGSDVTGFLTVSDLVGTSINDAPTITHTNKPLAGYWGAYLKTQIDDHTQASSAVQNRYSQTYNGVIPLHLDNENKELYARRVHYHTYVDVGAAPDDHNHDYQYLIPSDIFTNRNVTAHAWLNGTTTIYTRSSQPAVGDSYYTDQELEVVGGVLSAVDGEYASVTVDSTVYTRNTITDRVLIDVTSPSSLFAPIVHSHSAYDAILPNLASRGIYPDAVFKSEQYYQAPDPNDPEQEITIIQGTDLNELSEQGEYYIKDSNQNSNMPFTDFKGFVKVTTVVERQTDYTVDETTGAITINSTGRTNILQRARVDATGTEFTRYGYITETTDAQDNTQLTKTYTYGPWKVTEAESVIGNSSTINSGSAYTADRESAKTHIITLSADCTLTLSNLRVGETLDLQVVTAGSKTLTFNSVVILDTTDVGTFVCKFSNKTGTPQLDAIVVVLA